MTTLDVTDLRCPLTWVRTKLALERLGAGEALEVTLPPGEARENVPRSAREAGHDVTIEGAVVRITRSPGEAGRGDERSEAG